MGLLERPASWTPREAGFPHLFFPVFREQGPHRPTLPFPRLWLQPVELNKLAAGGLAIGNSRAGASYLLIYIPRRPARGPLLCTRPPPPGLRGLSGERGPLVLPTPKAGTCCSRPPARPARPARPAKGAEARLFSYPLWARRRRSGGGSSSSSRRRRLLPGRGSAAERGYGVRQRSAAAGEAGAAQPAGMFPGTS